MDPKTGWTSSQTVCRCCLAEGCYKDISTEYFWMGKREVYSEMLSETFDLNISFPTASTTSRLICEPCISRLRDACEFKKQVQDCEKTFVQHLDAVESSIDIDVPDPEPEPISEPVLKVVKIEQVKMEKDDSDDEYVPSGDDMDDDNINDDDYDDLDDEPLTKLATKKPKTLKAELEPESEPKASKRKITIKLKEPAKKPKVAPKIVSSKAKPTTSKATAKPQPDKKSKEHHERQNAEIMVKYTTVLPFRLPNGMMQCVFCLKRFSQPNDFREHMTKEHADFKIKHVFYRFNTQNMYLKADCTFIACRICKMSFPNLEQIVDHLESHTIKVNKEFNLGIIPFILDDERKCYYCAKRFPGLIQLSRHLSSHFPEHTCHQCGKSYMYANSLKLHLKFGHRGSTSICQSCSTKFDDVNEYKKHREQVKECWKHLCNICGEKFSGYHLKEQHLEIVHARPKKMYKCFECGEELTCRKSYRKHFKIEHSNEAFQCPYCDRKFADEKYLNDHVVIHTKERNFPCTVCSKSFPRKKNLEQHMWIHSEKKRFECEPCNKKFNQRVTWRLHMKNHHPGESVV